MAMTFEEAYEQYQEELFDIAFGDADLRDMREHARELGRCTECFEAKCQCPGADCCDHNPHCDPMDCVACANCRDTNYSND